MVPGIAVGPIGVEHRTRIAEILGATGVFRASEVDVALELFDLASSGADDDYSFVGAFSTDGQLAGFACWGPTPETDRTFDLYWLAVDPALAGTGAGTKLLAEVEEKLSALEARLVVAETSSRDDYSAARGFYEKRGFTKAARVRDFYAPSDDRVIYTKRLAPAMMAGTAGHLAKAQGVNR